MPNKQRHKKALLVQVNVDERFTPVEKFYREHCELLSGIFASAREKCVLTHKSSERLYLIGQISNLAHFIYYSLTGRESTITSVLNGSKTLKLTATLTGGKGDVAWQHAQLFRQPFDSQSEYPLDVAVFLKEPSRDTHL